jgi:hypothetical protein
MPGLRRFDQQQRCDRTTPRPDVSGQVSDSDTTVNLYNVTATYQAAPVGLLRWARRPERPGNGWTARWYPPASMAEVIQQKIYRV